MSELVPMTEPLTVGPRHTAIPMPSDWRDVPMPSTVARLPRTRSGIPVSWTTAWSSEQTPRRAFEPLVGAEALFYSGQQGEGTPKLKVSDLARTRKVAVLGLCQVCGRKLPGRTQPPWRQHPRWLADLRNAGQVIRIHLRNLPLIVDGWTCEPCLAYGLTVCPALVARERAGEPLRLLRVRAAELVSTIEHVPAVGDEPLVGHVKIAPTDYDVVDPDEWLHARGSTA